MPQYRQTTTRNQGNNFQNVMGTVDSLSGLIGQVGGVMGDMRQTKQNQQMLKLKAEEATFDKSITYLELADTIEDPAINKAIYKKGLEGLGFKGESLDLSVSSFVGSSAKTKQARQEYMKSLKDSKLSYKEKSEATVQYGLIVGLPVKEQINKLLNLQQQQEWLGAANKKHEGVQTLVDQKIETLYAEGKIPDDKYKAARAGSKMWDSENRKYLEGQLSEKPAYTISATAINARDLTGAIIAEASGQFLDPNQKKLLGELSPLQTQQIATSKTQQKVAEAKLEPGGDLKGDVALIKTLTSIVGGKPLSPEDQTAMDELRDTNPALWSLADKGGKSKLNPQNTKTLQLILDGLVAKVGGKKETQPEETATPLKSTRKDLGGGWEFDPETKKYYKK